MKGGGLEVRGTVRGEREGGYSFSGGLQGGANAINWGGPFWPIRDGES